MSGGDFVEGVMQDIAKELGKPYSALQSFTQKLKDNWIDSKESLAMMDEKSLQQLSFPLMLQKKLMERIAKINGTSGQRTMDIESGSKSFGNTMDMESSPQLLQLKAELNEIYRDIMGTDNFFSALLTIHTLVSNIAQNPNEDKFRKLNLEKPTLSALFSKSPAIERVFKLVGFRQNGQTQIFQLGEPGKPLKNLSLIEASCREIKNFGDIIAKLKEGLGVAGFSATGGKSNADVANMHQSDISKSYDMLVQIKAQREAMIKPTVPRRTRKIEENEIVKEKEALVSGQYHFAKELSPLEDAEDDKLAFTAEQRKEILKMFTEEPTFTSKRKQELKRLIETPVFTETVIRFRLPDGGIIESRFSPKERVKDLRQELEKHYNPGTQWFLYTTPPFQKLELKRLSQNSLEELQMVPKAIVHVAFVE